MDRKTGLIIVVASLVTGALALRVHNQTKTLKISASISSSSRPAFAISEPRDYVLHPQVVPEEAGAGPKRIISMAPSVTEIICALGMRDRLVGRTRYCQYIPDIQNVPSIGVMAESNYGMIKTLEPDLILATRNSGDTAENLRRLELPVETVPHEGLPEVYAAIKKIGQLCNRPKTAAALVSAISGDLEQLKATAAKLRMPPKRVIVLFGELPVPPKAVFVAGPGLFLDSMIEFAGHRNAAREVLKSSQGEIPLELLRILDPDVIVECRGPVSLQKMEEIYQAWSQVGNLRAIRNQQIKSIGGLEWLSAGPRMAIELHRFISVLSET